LKNGDVVLNAELFDGCRRKLLASPARFVGRSYNGVDGIAVVDQNLETGDCKVRRPHEDELCVDV
jgi:hypothetical protein